MINKLGYWLKIKNIETIIYSRFATLKTVFRYVILIIWLTFKNIMQICLL
jgi:hypothetical protein